MVGGRIYVRPQERYVSWLAMSKLDEKSMKLLREKNFAFLATIDAKGHPQVTPIWVDSDGEYVLLNTAMGRVKQKNTMRNPRVAVAVLDMSDPYRYGAIRGRVVEQIQGQVAEDHIDKLAKKYLGKDKYPFRQAGEKRVILKILPEHATPPQ
jgi:PPOX class probable F420-dependent enzyme